MPKRDPCKVYACRIQDCLSANNYQESACQEVIEDMFKCCAKWGINSFVCEGMKRQPVQLSKTENANEAKLRI